jgi:TonB family protein
MRTVALGVLVSLCTLGAQELAHDTAPRIISKVEAEYSDEGRLARLEGTSILRVTVGVDGRARDPHVVQYLGLGLDEKAVEAVNKWKFAPGTKDGQPVPVQAQIEVNFRLLDAKGRLARVELHLPLDTSRPVLEKAGAPHIAKDATSATATVTFDIDEKGVPVNLQIDKSSDDGWASEVADALGNWRFKPASKDGTPISVSCTMDFVRGN